MTRNRIDIRMAKQNPMGGTAAVTTPTRNSRSNGDRPVLSVKTNDNGQIFSHIRQKWLVETPEERVRQAYVVVLHNEYGFNLDQMDAELHVTGKGAGKARADVSIWRTARDKVDHKPPLIVVECKADNITIKPEDYSQGETSSLRAKLSNPFGCEIVDCVVALRAPRNDDSGSSKNN